MNKVCIYYFSGSGNTRYLCEAAKNGFEQNGWRADIVNIEDIYGKKGSGYLKKSNREDGADRINGMIDSKKFSVEEYDLIGVMFPIFAWQYPVIVGKFLKDLETSKNVKPAFVFITYGAIKGNVYFKTIRALRKKNYLPVWFGGKRCEDSHPALRRWWTGPFIIDNAPDKNDFDEAQNNIPADIIKGFNQKKAENIIYNPLAVILDIIAPIYSSTINIWMRKWVIRDKCSLCGLCSKYCPMGVIKIADGNNEGYPYAIKEDCIACYRCVNICPTDAFQSFFTRRGTRYSRMMNWVKGSDKSKE